MKERVKVMQDVYENRSTNKKAAGCTVIISGEMKEVMDKIIAKHPEYKSYAQAFAGVVERGIRVLSSSNPIWEQQCFWQLVSWLLGPAAWHVPGMRGTAL